MFYWKVRTKYGVDSYVKTEEEIKPELERGESAIRVPKSAYEMFHAIDLDMFKEHCYLEEFNNDSLVKFIDESFEPVEFSDNDPF